MGGALVVAAPNDGAVYVFESIPEPSTLVLAGSLLLSVFAIRRLAKVNALTAFDFGNSDCARLRSSN
jgi:hypothetical protein